MWTMKRYLMTLIIVLVSAFILEDPAFGAHEGASGQINVNTATKDELALLLWRSGIGDSVQIAENIIEYREAGGPFRNINELKEVKGINDYEFSQIRLWVKVEGESDYKARKKESPSGYPHPGVPVPRNGPPRGNFPEDQPYGPWRTRP
jgi:competence ComEA-like helix-hairpin-helix protein